MTLLHLNDPSFTDQHWQAYYLLLEQIHARYHSRFARLGWEKTKETFESLMEADPNYYRFVVFDEDSAVGWADIKIMSSDTEAQVVSVRADTIYEEAPTQFERVVADEIVRLLEKRGSTTAHMMAASERIAQIARHWKATELNRLDQFRLVRDKANVELMRRWIKEIPTANPNLRMEFFSPIPEQHLQVHTDLFIRYIREMPTERAVKKKFTIDIQDIRRDTAWRARNNMYIYTVALFDGDAMIGHSNVAINGNDPSDVYQAMSGVNSEYRGRGLSRWMKAALFFKVGEDFPSNQTMTTDMRAANAPIQKVNAEMGYELFSSGAEFELTVEGMREYLR